MQLRHNVKNEMTFIYAKFGADLMNISKVASHKTKWPRFIHVFFSQFLSYSAFLELKVAVIMFK